MFRSFLALALAGTAITPAFAQADVIGSGIAPSTAAHSQPRPINFATTAPTSGALVILMRNDLARQCSRCRNRASIERSHRFGKI